jgi:hypothetical protein
VPESRPLQVIIRDDDVSALTSVDDLATLYGPVWERDKPVCLFVVPLASPQIVEERPQAGPGEVIPLDRNTDLCVFLNRAILSRHVEIGLHGLRHGPAEFDTSNPIVVGELLNEARAVVQSVFPRAEVQTLVPPRENMSVVTRDVVLRQGFNICSASTTLMPPSRIGWWLHRIGRRLGKPGFQSPISCNRTRWLFPCDEYLFSLARRPERCLIRARRMASFCQRSGLPLICANHHWEFRGLAGNALRQAWHAFVEELLEREDVEFLTFNSYQASRARPSSGG